MKYTGWCQNNFNVQGYIVPFSGTTYSETASCRLSISFIVYHVGSQNLQ